MMRVAPTASNPGKYPGKGMADPQVTVESFELFRHYLRMRVELTR
jgi:hypothetical protein